MVANSAEEIIKYFPLTFAHLKDKKIGMRLIDYKNEDAYEVAYIGGTVETHAFYTWVPEYGTAELSFSLGINISAFKQNGADQQLASTLAHETMHAMMYEALTSGMTGINADTYTHENYPTRFHDWFIEGMAVILGGGTIFVDEVLRMAPIIKWRENQSDTLQSPPTTKNIQQGGDDLAYIKAALKTIALKEGRQSNTKIQKIGAAVYGTGYFALAYLGQLIENNGIWNEDEDVDVINSRT